MTAFTKTTWMLWIDALRKPYGWRVEQEDPSTQEFFLPMRHDNGLELVCGYRPKEKFNVSLFLPFNTSVLHQNLRQSRSFVENLLPEIEEECLTLIGHFQGHQPEFSEQALQENMDLYCGPKAWLKMEAISDQLSNVYGPGHWQYLSASYQEKVVNTQGSTVLIIDDQDDRLEEVLSSWQILTPTLNGELDHISQCIVQPCPSHHRRLELQQFLEEQRSSLPAWVFEKP